jgi:hypothetical protein
MVLNTWWNIDISLISVWTVLYSYHNMCRAVSVTYSTRTKSGSFLTMSQMDRKPWKVYEIWLEISVPLLVSRKKSSHCTDHSCPCVSDHFAVTLLLKLTNLCDWYRKWCTTMSNKLVHIHERSIILKYYIMMRRKQMGLFGFHWIKWKRKP